ncbi:fatty acid elongase [Labeo rohita]|uniref:Elongation of very long chain fatty acids protein n=1 Tax=Labeo rohita TaxID=84645 RepID=A0A498N1U8_LABRO|nr:fatty acid elongase [Labeo rohita]RXN27320.1 fatty acid elongase [Labeo rohita]
MSAKENICLKTKRLEMEAFNHRVNTYIDSWMGPRDSRVRGWLLLDNYIPTFAFTVMYLLIVWMGPRYMKNRQPYSCRALLVPYNLCLTLLSLYMFYELVMSVYQGGYNFFCQNTHSGGEADNRMMNVLWWYYFSKLIEFMDTFFFVLRKNNHQITFLHVYHHASMLNIWWFVMNWVPCGHSYFGATFNSFIHVLMYSYYGLSAVPAIRPYLWWKKYITQGQLASPVCPDHVPDILRCGLAMRFSNGLAVLPNQLYDHSYFPLHKLLHKDPIPLELNPFQSPNL